VLGVYQTKEMASQARARFKDDNQYTKIKEVGSGHAVYGSPAGGTDMHADAGQKMTWCGLPFQKYGRYHGISVCNMWAQTTCKRCLEAGKR